MTNSPMVSAFGYEASFLRSIHSYGALRGPTTYSNDPVDIVRGVLLMSPEFGTCRAARSSSQGVK